MDWITLLIELVGIAILIMWIVIPVREFRQILRIVRAKNPPPSTRDGGAGEPPA